MIRDNNTPLHEAIIANDVDTVALYKQELPEWITMPNRWGITPPHLAKLLGRKKAQQILEPGPKAPIQMQPKGEAHVRDCSEEEFSTFTGASYISTLLFPDYKTLVAAIQQCPWWLQKTEIGRECRWLGTLYAPDLLHGTVADIAIRWIDTQIGYGLFAQAPLQKNAFIVEYTGLLHRRYRLFPNTNDYCLHYPSGYLRWKVFMVDALHHGNYSRFINHSDTPNLSPVCVLHQGLLHTIFRANRSIDVDEQLTFSYGNTYWRKRTKYTL